MMSWDIATANKEWLDTSEEKQTLEEYEAWRTSMLEQIHTALTDAGVDNFHVDEHEPEGSEIVQSKDVEEPT